MKNYLMLALAGLLSLSCSKVTDSEADDAGASSSSSAPLSEMSSMEVSSSSNTNSAISDFYFLSSSSALASSSSVEQSVELRTLTVTVDYRHESGWVRGVPHYYPSSHDSVFLSDVHGDTLKLWRFGYFHAEPSHLHSKSFDTLSCVISKSTCSCSELCVQVEIEEAWVPDYIWNQANTDSAVLGNNPDLNIHGSTTFTADASGFTYSVIDHQGSIPSKNTYKVFERITTIPDSVINSSRRVPYNPNHLTLSADYTRDAKWAVACSSSNSYSLDTLSVGEINQDWVKFYRRSYSAKITDSTSDVSYSFVGTDTLSNSRIKGVVSRFVTWNREQYPLDVVFPIESGDPQSWIDLASRDSVVMLSSNFEIRDVNERVLYESISGWAKRSISYKLREDGFLVTQTVVDNGSSNPIITTCNVQAIRD